MEDRTLEAVVIGGGPAGLSAALMLGRARRDTLVIDSGRPRNRFASHMHGVLGHDGTAPGKLLRRGRDEVAGYGVAFRDGAVASVARDAGGLAVTLETGETILTRAVVVATGITDELPDIPGLAERWGTTVLHCPYCHGWEFRDRRLGVLATSPMSLHQAELVRQWSADVILFSASAGELGAEQERRLRSRGLDVVASPVVEVVGDGARVTAVRTEDGAVHELEAFYTAGAPRPHDAFLAPLELAREEGPFGSVLRVDATGATSDDRVWAVGNVVNPPANVPVAMAAGTMAGAMVNATLVAAEFDAAAGVWPEVAQPDYWERRYRDTERVWSGRINAVLAATVAALEPGTALDLGCGEGADVVGLAEQGWHATGIDISTTAIHRGRAAAEERGLAERTRFLVGDLSRLDALPGLGDDERFDLVTASFLHSPVALSRTEVLRLAADRVAPGGHLLITSHAGFPAWASKHVPEGTPHPVFLSPEEEIAALALDPESWETVRAESVGREVTAPDGTQVDLDDAIVLLRRR